MALFNGTDGNDSILRDLLSAGVTSDPASTGTLTGEPNEIHAGGGNDTVEAGDGDGDDYGFGDWIDGGAGNDLLTGGAGWDSLLGGRGNDTIIGGEVGAYADEIDGGAGRDLIRAADNDFNWIDGGSGIDTMYGGAFDDRYLVDDEDDLIVEATNGGFESVTCSASSYVLAANVENLYFDLISGNLSGTGNALGNWIETWDGDDTINGLGGNDWLYSYGGADKIDGGTGDDVIGSGDGADCLLGGAGRDWLYAGAGDDDLRGGSGSDYLYGDEGLDTMRGGDGDDSLVGGGDADRLIGGSGDDTFIFWDLSDSPASRRDVIAGGDGATAFQGAGTDGGDIIDLINIDADFTTSGWQTFVFGGTGTGHLSLVDSGTDTLVRGNLDDDNSFEFQVLIADGAVKASAYSADDFLLAFV